MKNYTITVNGNVYDVTVEEGGAGSCAPVAPVAAPKAAAPKAAAPKAVAPSAGAGSVKITCPMQGKILGVKVAPGQAVKKGDVVAILEAMKMENDIVATQDGTIASVDVKEGEAVEVGAVIVTLN